jgi:hypothetical protein
MLIQKKYRRKLFPKKRIRTFTLKHGQPTKQNVEIYFAKFTKQTTTAKASEKAARRMENFIISRGYLSIKIMIDEKNVMEDAETLRLRHSELSHRQMFGFAASSASQSFAFMLFRASLV